MGSRVVADGSIVEVSRMETRVMGTRNFKCDSTFRIWKRSLRLPRRHLCGFPGFVLAHCADRSGGPSRSLSIYSTMARNRRPFTHRTWLRTAACLLMHLYAVSAADYYKLLGVSRDASHKEIKKAYRQKSLGEYKSCSPPCLISGSLASL